MRHHDRIGRQVIGQDGRLVEEERQVILDAGRQRAGGNVLVERDARGVALEGIAEAAAELVAAGLADRELAGWQEADFGYRIEAALGIDVEGAQGLDPVIEQLDAIR